MGKHLLLTLAILGLVEYISAANVLCYHGTWSTYRTGNGSFKVSDTPANLCTHYIYTFAALSDTTWEIVSADSWLDLSLNGYADAVALKKTNPNLKVILAIGGFNAGSANYSSLAADPVKRATFVSSVVAYLQKYEFDGLDFDWEYPAKRDTTHGDADKVNYVLLLEELHEAFEPHGLLLSAAVSAAPNTIDESYDVPALSKYLDLINVMSYDFHGSWDNVTGFNSPLYGSRRENGTASQDFNVAASIHAWLERGALASKINLGVPLYGRTFILSNPKSHKPGSPTTLEGGAPGPYTATSGFWGYNEILEEFNAGGWTLAWDKEQQVPYAYSNDTWLSYDNPKSLALKAKYAKSLGLAGVMAWSIETEDRLGQSGTTFPLLKAINNALKS